MLSVPEEMVLYAGARRTIVFARTAAGRLPVQEFLETQDVSDAEFRRLEHLIRLLGDTGRIANADQFKKLKGSELWEFRVGGLRVLAWQAGAYCLLLRAAAQAGLEATPVRPRCGRSARPTEHRAHDPEGVT